jgi:hypothetical protein
MFFEVLSLTYHSPITIESPTYRVLRRVSTRPDPRHLPTGHLGDSRCAHRDRHDPPSGYDRENQRCLPDRIADSCLTRRALRFALSAFRLATVVVAERIRLRDIVAGSGIGLGRAWRG